MKKFKKSKGKVLILVLFLVCVLSSLNSAFAQRGRFTAKVTNEEGNPIEGAIIIATNPNALVGRVELKTKKDGKFLFAVRETGVWQFKITANGFHNYIVDVSLSALKKNPPLTFALKKITGGVGLTGPVVEKELFDRAKELYDNKDYTGALSHFEEFLQKNPAVYQVYYNIGLCHQELGDWDKALENYEQFLEKIPKDDPTYLEDQSLKQAVSSTYYKMGQCYIKLEQFDKALESFEKTVELNPDDPNTYYNVAEVYFYTDHLKEAVEFYQKSIEKKPDFVESYLKLGYAYLKLEDKPNTIKYLEKYLELNPTSEQAELVKSVIKDLKENK